MALLNKLCSVQGFNFKIIYNVYRCGILGCLLRNKSMVVDVDVLENFTIELLQKNSNRWEGLKVQEIFSPNTKDELTNEKTIDVKYFTVNEIDTIFQDTLDEHNKNKISLLVNECIKHKKCPTTSVLIHTLSFMSQQRDIEGIKNVKTLCESACPNFLSLHSDFNHYLAEAIWLKGNVLKAIALFAEVYETNIFLRRRVRLMLRYLMYEAVTNRSEAVTVCLVNFAEDLAKRYEDHYPLMSLWLACFLSDWYTDQCVALKLLETNDGFLNAMISHVPFAVSASLKNHKTEPVYRLMEILLKNDLKMQYSIILVALFDYRYRQGDLLSCLEIYKWSTKHKVNLPTIQHEKFLNMLLNYETHTEIQKASPSIRPGYQLKF